MEDKGEKVLESIYELTRDVVESADEMYCQHVESRYAYNMLSNEYDFTGGAPFAYTDELIVVEMDAAIDEAAMYAQEFRKELRKFDQQLTKLIELRGKLAEEIDAPMFSNIGENKRYPKRDTYNL